MKSLTLPICLLMLAGAADAVEPLPLPAGPGSSDRTPARIQTERRERLRTLSPDERERYRTQMRERMQALSPEERRRYWEQNGMTGRGQGGGYGYGSKQDYRSGPDGNHRYGQGGRRWGGMDGGRGRGGPRR